MSKILSPDQIKAEKLTSEINRLCKKYQMALVPVVHIIGNNIQANIEIVPRSQVDLATMEGKHIKN